MTEPKLIATEQDIAQTCSYITDDVTIAAYHGVSISRVKKVRSLTKDVKFRRKFGGASVIRILKDAPAIGTTSEERGFRVNAKEGSAALLAALVKFFYKREKELRLAARAELGL